MEMNMEMGKIIRTLRMSKRVHQEDVARYLGVSAQAVSKCETCAALPDITLLPAIAVYFGVSIDELFQLPDESRFERIENMMQRESRIAPETFHQAVGFLKDILVEQPDNVRACTDLADLYNHRAAGDRRMAAEYARRAIELAPEEKPGWVAYQEASGAVCGDEWYDNHFEAIEYFKEFLRKNPENFPGLYAIIENLLADKRYDEAVPYIRDLQKIKDDYQAVVYLGDVAMGRGEREEALRLWDQAVEKSPDKWQVYCDRADRLKKLGKVREAMADYEHCFEMQQKPRLTDGLYSLAQMHELLGEYDAAIDDYRRILKCTEEDYGEVYEPVKEEIDGKIRKLQERKG